MNPVRRLHRISGKLVNSKLEQSNKSRTQKQFFNGQDPTILKDTSKSRTSAMTIVQETTHIEDKNHIEFHVSDHFVWIVFF